MNRIQIGLVIPIIQRGYIFDLLKQIKQTLYDNKVIICVVNDGNIKIKKHLINNLSKEVELLNLEKNLCFAGANNAGWKLLINKYPSIKYLGTINDDTIPQNKWLDNLVRSMEDNTTVAACSPVMMAYRKNIFSTKVIYSSTWKLGNGKHPMVIDKEKITKDTHVSVLGGFCLLAKAEALFQIDYFDERYKNSCEDIDLCLKLRKKNWDLMVSYNSFVIHKCGKSRFKSNTNTNISKSRKLLFSKWGNNLKKYNL